MGKQVYESAIANPDNLAKIASSKSFAEGVDAEVEIYSAAHRAWMRVAGKSDVDEYPERYESAELVGGFWDFDNPILMRQHLPILTALYES